VAGALLVIVAFQFVGELVVRTLRLPLPGAVVGMVLLLGVLTARGRVPESLRQTTHGLLQHLSLLFVPAGAGIVAIGPTLAREWLAVAVVLVASTAVTIAVTALTTRWLARHWTIPRTSRRPRAGAARSAEASRV
jgi:holin-like protein